MVAPQVRSRKPVQQAPAAGSSRVNETPDDRTRQVMTIVDTATFRREQSLDLGSLKAKVDVIS